jgi:hypothetical protein
MRRDLLNLENKLPYAPLRTTTRDPVKLRAQAPLSASYDPPTDLLNLENKTDRGIVRGGSYSERHKPPRGNTTIRGDISLVSEELRAGTLVRELCTSSLQDMVGLEVGDHTR